MKAAVNTEYGPAGQVVHIAGRRPVQGQQVRWSSPLPDRRLADGRLAPGRCFARMISTLPPPGHFPAVVAVGAAVTRFKMGDEVFGVVGAGAHAEYIAIAEDKTIIAKPAALGYDDAAALPFGGLSALVFLRDFAKIQPGQKVLVTGASGGVGVFAVQIARHLGAEVTGLTSTGNAELVRSLGAVHVIDYKQTDFAQGDETYDVIFDTAGVSSFRKAARVLAPGGKFVPLEFGVPEILGSMRADRQGRRIVVGVNSDSAEDLGILADLVERGAVRAVIDSIEPLSRIVDAYRRVAGRHKLGAVVVDVAMPISARAAA